MADDDVLSDEETASFLSGTSSISGVDFSAATGINAQQIATAIAGSIVFVITVGVNTVVQAVAAAYTAVIDGFAGFLSDGLITAVFTSGIEAIRGAWAFGITEFGLFAYPVGLAVLLATGYVTQLGIEQIREAI